jgi:GT2 family glycosyltransferase
MNDEASRSFVIPILDFSPHSPYNIRTLLEDLERIPGEVICIFNSREVYNELHTHPRIDKYCYNKLNAGVSRSWNLGINLAEGRAVFIMNADLHITPNGIAELEHYLFTLDKAVIVGPQGSHIDFKKLKLIRYFEAGTFKYPVRTHDVSGFLFVMHLEKVREHRLMFDVRFSPCFFEEWDMGLQVMQAGLACYAVPVDGFEHIWGVSKAGDETTINYFGRELRRRDILLMNRQRFADKWRGIVDSQSERFV